MKEKITATVLGVVKGVDQKVSNMEREVELVIQPIQKTVFTRFPILFTLLVTFGVAVTFLGFERIISEITYVNERPYLLLSIGIGVLAVTGTLYKKLG